MRYPSNYAPVFLLLGILFCHCKSDSQDPYASQTTRDVVVYSPDIPSLDTLQIDGNSYTDKLTTSKICNDPDNPDRKLSLSIGNHTYYAVSENKVWKGSLEVVKGTGCHFLILSGSNPTINYSTATFSTDNSGIGSISVAVDGRLVGSLNEIVDPQGIPIPSISCHLSSGRHTYIAKSTNGLRWQGEFNSTPGSTDNLSFYRSNMAPLSTDSCHILFVSKVRPNQSIYLERVYMGKTLAAYPDPVTDVCDRKWVVSIIKPLNNYRYSITDATGYNVTGIVDAFQPAGCVVVNIR